MYQVDEIILFHKTPFNTAKKQLPFPQHELKCE